MRLTRLAEFRLRTALLFSLAVAAAVVLSFRGIYESDLWWHLAQGRETAAGRLVRTNVFNFIYPDYPQAYTSWLYDLAGYLAWQAADGAGIQLLHGVLLAVMFVLVFLACRERAPVPAAIAIMAIGFFVVEPRAIPRPHVASFAGLAACTLLIERARRLGAAAPLRWAIPIVAVWSNLHAECVFGVLLVGVFAGGEFAHPVALSRREALNAIAISAGCVLATLVNPYGWGLERYLYENWSVPQILNIAELLPPALPAYRAFFVYAALAAVSMVIPWRAASLSELAAVAIFGALGAKFLRFTPLLFIVTAPVVADRVGRLIARGIDGRAVVATTIAASLLISRLPIRVLANLQAGNRAVAPPETPLPGTAGVRAGDRTSRTGIQQHESRRLSRLGALSRHEDLPGWAAADGASGAYPRNPHRLARPGRLGRARGRRRLGGAVSAAPEPALRRRQVPAPAVGHGLLGRSG